MRPIESITKARLLFLGKSLLLLVFAISFPQWPLYSATQNTYFVHGLANAMVGFLNRDWLAKTTDPFPVFSALVDITIRVFGEKAFYIFFIILLAIFGYSILGIASEVFGVGSTTEKYLTYFVLITMLFSGLLARPLAKFPALSSIAPVFEPNGLLTRGVAEQSIVGQIFQPSVFGVFLVLSIFLFLREKPIRAVACLAVAATFHASYLLSAAVLTSMYMGMILVKEKDYRRALILGTAAFILILPALTYNFLNFRPTSPDLFALAQSILVDYRIPHHAVVARWFGPSAVFQIMIVAFAIYLVRRTRIFPILFGAFLTSTLLTIVQVLTRNQSLALLFPWRISTFLVPIASSLILAKIVSIVFQLLKNRPLNFVKPLQAVALVIILMIGFLGARQTITLFDSPEAGSSASIRFIADTYQPGNLYLVPTEMELFRLAAKVPIFVDYKSHPYKDTEVIDWFDRVQTADRFYAASGQTACQLLDNISDEYGITDVILRSSSSITKCRLLHSIYQDEEFTIYAVLSDEARTDPKLGGR